MDTQFALQSIILILFILSFGLYHYTSSYNDFMMITLRQFPNACDELNESEQNACNSSITNVSWIIQSFQGFQNKDVRTYCDNRFPFIYRNILSYPVLNQKMLKFWPSIGNTTIKELWGHNYQKYGTCAVQQHMLGSEREYFHNSIELYEQLDELLNLNQGKDFTNMELHKLTDLEKMFKEKLKHSVFLQCYKSKSKNKQVLAQVGFCVERKNINKIVDCPPGMNIDMSESHLWDVVFINPLLTRLNKKIISCTKNIQVQLHS